MYMREMGTVELLTREGEIEIAKRIEGGLQAMMLAICASPTTIAEILRDGRPTSRDGEMPISEVVDGFVPADEADDYVAEEDFDEFDEDDDDDGNGGSKALTKKLEELKVAGARASSTACAAFDKMRKAYEKEGYESPAVQQGAARLQRRADDDPLHGQDHREAVRHPALQVDDVRRYERELRKIVVDKCGMPQEHFIKDLPAQPAEPEVGREARSRPASPTAPCWRATCPPVQELQQKLIDLQSQRRGAAGRPEGDQQDA